MTIVVHPGSSHFDDFLSCCLINSKYSITKIDRREPTEDDFKSLYIWVVDIGGKYEPEFRNFDHHQYIGGDCSYRLIAKYLGFDSLAMEMFEWWGTMNTWDTMGPSQVAKEIGLPDYGNLFKLSNPIVKYMLDCFEKDPDSMIPWMREFGKFLVSQLEEMTTRLKELEMWSEIHEVRGLKVITHNFKENPALGIHLLNKREKLGLAASIIPDDRGDGWAIFRFGNNPRINLFVLERQPRIIFAHKGGFLAKTSKMDIKEAIALLSAATF